MTSVAERVDDVHADGRGRRTYRLAPGTELLGEYRDSAYNEPKFLVQRADGQAMQLPQLLYRVACSLDGRATDEIAAELNAELGTELTADQVSFLVEERLGPVGLVAPDGTDVDGTGGEAATPPMPVRSDLLLALRYRAGVIPASVAWRIAGVFQPLFRRPVWWILLAAFVAVDVGIALQGDLLDRLVAGVAEMGHRPGLLLAVLGLTVLSGVLHEFGHVGACRFGGARPGDIGVGMYLVWPAFYSTVTDSYRLDRVGRLRTDLGGLFVDAVFMAGLGLVYLRTGEPWLLIALLGMHIEAAWQLLPNLRLDGYYILGDLVGVPDLFSYVKPALLSLLPGRAPHPALQELKPQARRIIVAWVAAVVPTLLFWLAVLLVALPRLLPAAWDALLDYVQGLDAAARAGDIGTTALGITELLFLLLPWAGGVMALWLLVDTLRRRVAGPRWLGRVGAPTRATVRRLARLGTLAGLGALLLVRVGQVTLSHPATPQETRLADSALSGVEGIAGGPSVDAGEWLVREQLVGFAWLTGAFERHATVVAGARELAVLACAVLVICLIALAGTTRVRFVAVALPLVAVLAMGPALTTLGTVGPGVVGAAWAAAGILLLVRVRSRAGVVAGLLSVAVGAATEPLVVIPLAAGLGALFLRSGRAAGSTPLRHRSGEAAPLLDRRTSRHPRHACPAEGPVGIQRWLGLVLVLPIGAAAAALSTGSVGMPLDGSERAVLLLAVVPLVAAGLFSRPLRAPAAAAGAALVLAALPGPWAGNALPLVLVAGVVLAVLVTEAFTRLPPQDRPNPFFRAGVAVPALLLTVVGALFLPVNAQVPPHAALASWITGPDSPSGAVLVPAGLWGDLVRDGVPSARLIREGAGSDAAASWAVAVGAPQPGAESATTLAGGGVALTVGLTERGREEQRLQAAAREREAARAEVDVRRAEQQAARSAFGSLVADLRGLTASDDVLAALRDGSVDLRVVAGLSSLAREVVVTVPEVPVVDGEDPGLPRRQILISSLGGMRFDSPEVAEFLTEQLATWPAPLAPAEVATGEDGVLLTWAPSPTDR